MEKPNTQAKSPSCLLAVEDTQFLLRDERRWVRTRIRQGRAAARDWAPLDHHRVGHFPHPLAEQAEAAARRRARPRRTARRRLQRQAVLRNRARIRPHRLRAGRGFASDNVIATSSGPGIMEAANRGAFDAGAPSMAADVGAPRGGQNPNPYITPELSFRFCFAMRKMHLAMRANALRDPPAVSAPWTSCSSCWPLGPSAPRRRRPVRRGLLAQDRRARRARRGGHDLARRLEAVRVRDGGGRLGLAGAPRPARAHAERRGAVKGVRPLSREGVRPLG